MTTIEDIIRIAVNAQDGMKDMVGNPTVAHVLAVGLMGKTVAEQKAGFLHDVVEDPTSPLTTSAQRAWKRTFLPPWTCSPIAPV